MYHLIRFLKFILWLIGTMLVLAFSLLPLSALLVALPFVSPGEAVLTDSVPETQSFWRRLSRRFLGLISGLVVLVVLLAAATEVANMLPLPGKGQLGPIAENTLSFAFIDLLPNPVQLAEDGITPPPPRDLLAKQSALRKRLKQGISDPLKIRDTEQELDKINKRIESLSKTSTKMRLLMDPELTPINEPISKLLPSVLIQHWPIVFLIIYAMDMGMLLAIGKVPLAYNIRNLLVRWRISLLTATAFTVVVALLVALLAFVNGMSRLNQETGIPGNVFILSDGATDELFSNLGYGEIDNVFREVAKLNVDGVPLKIPVGVKQAVPNEDGTLVPLERGMNPPAGSRPVFLASKEIYFVINQPIPPKEGQPPRRRFLQVRAMENGPVAGMVHNIQLTPGGKWFTRAGVEAIGDKRQAIQCVIGEGAAGTLGLDAGKPKLEPGDMFQLGDLDWIVVGVMKADGTTFGSEIWVQNIDTVTKTFGKKGNYTTLVVRTDAPDDEALASAKAFAYHLQNRYSVQKLKAFAEPDYYLELTKTNDSFLNLIVGIAAVMAIGGVFGVMNTMFASITARIREVGVLRILGYKRWQILISFMLESLTIAFVGGVMGCALGYLVNGIEARSIISSGNASKGVSLRMLVDYQTVCAGILFTLMMGRLGGLVPAMSAMRMKILDSLK